MSMNVVDGKRKKKNAFSLEGLKEAREGTVSRLDQYEDEDVDDVYDLVDEDKYASIVESRRKMDDFVVDDNGLGYHDDGEEHLGIGEDTMDAKKRLKDAQRDGDNRLSKKARRLADSSGPKGSIMRHMQAGMPTGGQRTQAEKKASVQTEMDIDSLLAAKPTPAPSTFRRPQPRKYQTGQTGHAPRAQEQEQEEEQEQYVDDEGFEMQEEVTKVEGEGGVEPFSATGVEEAPAPAPVKLSLSKGTRKLKASEPMQAALGGQAQGAGAVWGYKPDLDADVSTLAVMAQIDSMAGAGAAAASGSGFGKIDPRSWLQYKAAVTTEAGAEAGVEGEAEGEGEKGEEYVNMFWLDAAENNGVLYLFGKIAVNDLQPPPGAPAQAPAQAQAQTQKRYVSCCVVVHGSERNLFVLPRSAPDTFKEDGSAARLGMADVYKELSSMLVPSVVPRSQGQAFRCKAVRRRYAFEHGDIPREEAEYLKVVYSATHGVPNPTQCAGGRTYERIFGAGASALELFLLKRKLMGPCWITIRKPKMNPSQVSWCRVEIAIGNPKDIERTSNGGPSPPLTSLSVSIKTAVNPTTHMHEVIMLSGVVHHRIEQDADSDTHPRHQKRFTFIRQLGVSCGPTYPATFPHDLAKAALEAKFTSCSNERALLSAFFARMQAEDPDVLCSHNLLGFEADVILARALVNKLPNWSILGRLRKSRAPRSINDKDIAAGRILCDTYKAAKEFLRETTYSLTHLAASQLKVSRVEVDPMDVPKFFSSTKVFI
ncbi:ribonuclease H-like domain-containing protein [Ochromonadaceae sp. CCMP2298]|nr:ribonuclease H-like domain-containing protein [Ochromonadaceae sp. CCMP2298]